MRVIAIIAAALLLGGCESVQFYTQAIRGQIDVMRAARPIESWLTDPATPADLRARLEAARAMRRFASARLSLPDNGTFESYADLQRPYVLWNVFAAPEFSVEPKQQCFPITGCVSYRGFFSERLAREHAAKLRGLGYDVYVGGVPAYSTLGWFDDPLLSTFIRYPEGQLARLIFHELAHQIVYVSGDTTFNESFAVSVEDEGVRRWLEAEHRPEELKAFRAAQARKRAFGRRIKHAREELEALYSQPLSPDELRRRKAEVFAKLRSEYGAIIPAEPNNAFIVSVALYTQLVPGFERLLAECNGDLPSFYEQVRKLAKESRAERRVALEVNGTSSPGPSSALRQ